MGAPSSVHRHCLTVNRFYNLPLVWRSGDARWLVSVEPDLECRVGPEVAPAACFDGSGHQVLGPPLSERGKLEHPPELADLGDCDGIHRPQGDGEAEERGWMTSGGSTRVEWVLRHQAAVAQVGADPDGQPVVDVAVEPERLHERGVVPGHRDLERVGDVVGGRLALLAGPSGSVWTPCVRSDPAAGVVPRTEGGV